MRAIVSAVVFLAVLMTAPGMLSQSGPTEAPAGFDLEGNGFLQEFCANQNQLPRIHITEDPGGRVQPGRGDG